MSEVCTPAERLFLNVVAIHGLAHGVGECQEAWGLVVEERREIPTDALMRELARRFL